MSTPEMAIAKWIASRNGLARFAVDHPALGDVRENVGWIEKPQKDEEDRINLIVDVRHVERINSTRRPGYSDEGFQGSTYEVDTFITILRTPKPVGSDPWIRFSEWNKLFELSWILIDEMRTPTAVKQSPLVYGEREYEATPGIQITAARLRTGPRRVEGNRESRVPRAHVAKTILECIFTVAIASENE